MKNIIFLNRAYNDMDIQSSLIDAFAGDSDCRVSVIGYPCDGFIGAPGLHEATPYLRRRGVKIGTVFDSPHAPNGLKILYGLQCFFRDLRLTVLGNVPGIAFILKVSHVGLIHALGRLMRGRQGWLERAAKDWHASAVILDEVSAQPDRSQIVDFSLPALAKAGTKIYTILTGQNIYNDPFPAGGKRPSYKPSVSARVFVPSLHDRHIFNIQFPAEPVEVMGNLRMNPVWIETLHKKVLVPPFFDKERALKKLPQGRTRVVFMLSKINYGIVDPDVLADTVKRIGNMPGVAVAIKPHTRGMKLDFMDIKDAGNAIDASYIPSALLIEWADVLFFTGSGIAFHGMYLNKRAGFLKYCQELETIFDKGESVEVMNSPDEVSALVEKIKAGEVLPEEHRLQVREWLQTHIEAGASDGDVAALYKARIKADL